MTRINQYLASATGLSRRAADAAVAAGRVAIDNLPAKLGDQVKEGSIVTFDGQSVQIPTSHTYVLINKPVGYVASRVRQGTDPTIYELLPRPYHNLRPAGRLDRDSSGLMLLSDDGTFIQKLTHPSYGKDKIYELTLARPLTQADHRQLESGIILSDGPSRVRILQSDGREVTVALSEGRNRQLRRTFGALGYTVERLHRVKLGPYSIDGLAPGEYKEVKPA